MNNSQNEKLYIVPIVNGLSDHEAHNLTVDNIITIINNNKQQQNLSFFEVRLEIVKAQ